MNNSNDYNDLGVSKNIILRLFLGFFIFVLVFFIVMKCFIIYFNANSALALNWVRMDKSSSFKRYQKQHLINTKYVDSIVLLRNLKIISGEDDNGVSSK